MLKERDERNKRTGQMTLDDKSLTIDDSNLTNDGRTPTIDGRTLEEIISDVAEQEYARIPPAFITPEKLALMSAERKAAREAAEKTAGKAAGKADNETVRRKRMYKVAGGIAAVFVLMLLGTLVAFNVCGVDVGADKNQKQEIVTEDGVVIEDGGYGAEYDDGGVWSTDVWEDVSMAKALYPQILIPEYIPEGYEFEQLVIEGIETGNLLCHYSFCDNVQEYLELEVLIQDDTLASTDVNESLRTLASDKGTIYIQEGDMKIATIQYDDGISIILWSDLSDDEIIEIMNALED